MADRYAEFVYAGFTGLNSQDLPFLVGRSELTGGSGFHVRSGVLRQQPDINGIFTNALYPPPLGATIPNAPDGNPFLGFKSFIDTNNLVHTIGVTAANCYQIGPPPGPGPGIRTFSWSLIGAIPSPGTVPYALQSFIRKLYFTNSNQLYFVDGLTGTNVQTATTISGGLFLTSVANSLIMAYTFEGSSIFPQRVRWSAPNQPTQWDPTANLGAGFNDLQDIADGVSGLAVIGTNAYVFTPNDITVMSPTGNSTLPFVFDHLWFSPSGLGCTMPQSIASFGPHCGFVGSDGIYILSVTGIENIGKKIYDYFFDVVFGNNATGATSGYVFGNFFPVYVTGQGSPYRSNLSYRLYVSQINTSGVPVTYVFSYDLDSKAWSVYFIAGALNARPELISVG